jgi:RimJ/RimL family protein N-acetyltransferase
MTPRSSRLAYREVSPADRDQLLSLARDPHIRRFLFDGQIVTQTWAAEAIEQSRRQHDASGLGLWLLFDPALGSGAPIGFAGFFHFEEIGPEPQLVYALKRAHTGQGYATEAAEALIHHARARAGLGDIFASVDEPNVASVRILEKLGFEATGEMPGAFGRMRLLRLPAGRPPRMLRTRRLVLRPWRDDDLPAFAALNADPRVMANLPSRLSREESDALAERIRRDFEARGYGLWAVEVARIAPFIGFVGLAHPTFEIHFTPCVEVGWRLAAEHWGRGLATEASEAVLVVAFVHLGLEEVVSFTASVNAPSRKVMEKLGMRHTEEFDHPRLPEGHRLRRHVLYRLGRAAWSARMPP